MKEYMVGRPNYKSAIIYTIITIAWAIVLFFQGKIIGVIDKLQATIGFRIFSITLILISIFIVLPGLCYCQLMWKVDNQTLKYTFHDNTFMKIISFFKDVFIYHHITYQVSINVEQIDYVAVTYEKILRGPLGMYGYGVLFETHMKDGTIFTFESLVTRKRREFNNAVEFMKSIGIEFKDKYQILEELKKDIPISYYLEKIEKEKSL